MKHLPNALTLLRMLLSIALCFLFERRAAFLTIYALCGLSDALDGYLARRLQATTALGAKLDSLADALFFGVSMAALLSLVLATSSWLVLVLLALVAAVRVANLAITRGKFRQWGIVHTVGNKAAGLALFAAIPACLFIGGFPLAVIVPLFAIALLSAAEETVLLLREDAYDPNRKGLLWKP